MAYPFAAILTRGSSKSTKQRVKPKKTKERKHNMSTNLGQIVAPPLDLDLSSIDVSMPLLAAGIYDLQFAKVEPKTTKAGAAMLSLDLVTTSPAQSQDGAQLGAGIHVFSNINLAPSGKATWEIVVKNIAAVTQAAGLVTNYGDFAANAPAMLTGKIARCKVDVTPAVSKDGKTYKAKNEIEVWMKAA